MTDELYTIEQVEDQVTVWRGACGVRGCGWKTTGPLPPTDKVMAHLRNRHDIDPFERMFA